MQISEEGWKAIQAICDLEYMGAAEFEFGALPKCLGEMHKNAPDLVTFPLVIKRADIKPNWNHEHAQRMARRDELTRAKKAGTKPPRAKKPQPARTDDATVFVICRKDDKTEVIEHIKLMAAGKTQTKRGHGFDSALDPTSEYDSKVIGWLELDNGFLWFLGYEEYVGMAKLLNLTPEKKEAA